MSKDTTGTHRIQALSRGAYLAQLYDARTGTLIPGFRLFQANEITKNSHIVALNTSNITHKEVKSINDRTSSLNISAQIEVSILGGAITIGGSGSYLNSKEDTSESNTVACIAQYRTRSETLEVNSLRSLQAIDNDEQARIGATHFVASITYGGNVVGTLTQKSANKNDNTNVKGSFSLEAFKGLGKAFSASGSAELSLEEKEKINSYNLDVKLVGDVSFKDQEAPTSPADLITLFKKSGQLVGEGIPCEIDLLPISMLQSNIPTYRELDSAELTQISRLYNRIIKLENSRTWLTDMVEDKEELFPSFFNQVRDRGLTVSQLVETARGKLRRYLEAYRGGQEGIPAPSAFKDSVESDFIKVSQDYEEDLATWRDYQERLRAAEQHSFPGVSVSQLTSKMNRADKAVIAVILVPEQVKFVDLLNTYRVLAADIRQWRISIDEPKKKEGSNDPEDKPAPTEYMSLYADALRDAPLLRLDDSTNSLKTALETVRKTSNVAFLTYGIGVNAMGGLTWDVLNQEGWGIIINKEEQWRYIGNVHNGLPHGSGVMSYVDKTRYAGEWLKGQREGEGEVFDEQGNSVAGSKGVYLKNVLVSDAVVVVLKVINKMNIPIDQKRIVLRSTNSAHGHVQKIGAVMGWALGKRFRLEVPDGHRLIVDGDMIDPAEDPSVKRSFWALESGMQIKAFVL
ncbi:hypothetical protein K435DRAFT_505007 [Dendrothele bispora CBS 962.96]|uniref:SNTX MACPF/CDC-like domain-containing protein n=1 Tax=Dendrothele bispora (strain CBS 962.96) TaxID=1314807 RepID=A0A4S8KW48_DENBC|nr:hypothetical protein K435DRAFT_505007 [Dendrothele bispora CBS 962.96]